MSFSPETRSLLEALRRGETVELGALGTWCTSGGAHAEGKSVYILVRAGLAEYIEWGTAGSYRPIGTKARLKPPVGHCRLKSGNGWGTAPGAR